MRFSINNIGIIKSADVKVDGLTVISGANNSGKTTVGKALYSIVSATENLSEKQDIDLAEAIYNRIRRIVGDYNILLDSYDDIKWLGLFDTEKEKNIVEKVQYIRRFEYQGQESLSY